MNTIYMIVPFGNPKANRRFKTYQYLVYVAVL